MGLYKIKRKSPDKVVFSLKTADEQKFFAIISDVWYNVFTVKKLRYGGLNYPFYFLFKNVGIAVGVIIFTLGTFVADDFIFSFTFTGSGSVYERNITDVLSENGVSRFSRFSRINLSVLEDVILSKTDQLSFVSLKKVGNRLVVDSAVANKPAERLSGNAGFLKSDVEGEIVSLKVYRGTAIKNVGDAVKVGDIIVDGYAVNKEQTTPVNVIATATVLYGENYVVYSSDESFALALAEEWSDKHSVKSECVRGENENGCFFKIKLYFTKVITAG